MSDKAKAAIAAVLKRVQRDPRVAYYICPMSETYDKLVAAHCELHGLDEQAFRRDFETTLQFEAPPDVNDALYALAKELLCGLDMDSSVRKRGMDLLAAAGVPL